MHTQQATGPLGRENLLIGSRPRVLWCFHTRARQRQDYTFTSLKTKRKLQFVGRKYMI